jgi:hypothetical protein
VLTRHKARFSTDSAEQPVKSVLLRIRDLFFVVVLNVVADQFFFRRLALLDSIFSINFARMVRIGEPV